jgi:hypothetical protein
MDFSTAEKGERTPREYRARIVLSPLRAALL